ncbi:MAG: hypothetical protein AB200_01765 [Parcubacteria bacterium C7867-005]|nr:MAG: hypothetical protein AB200_01765 [Parcubacteria bacterium C7867-005]
MSFESWFHEKMETGKAKEMMGLQKNDHDQIPTDKERGMMLMSYLREKYYDPENRRNELNPKNCKLRFGQGNGGDTIFGDLIQGSIDGHEIRIIKHNINDDHMSDVVFAFRGIVDGQPILAEHAEAIFNKYLEIAEYQSAQDGDIVDRDYVGEIAATAYVDHNNAESSIDESPEISSVVSEILT